MNALLTMHQVAARLGVPVTTLKNWLYHPAQRRPDFPRSHLICDGRMGRSKARWTVGEVDAWRNRHAV